MHVCLPAPLFRPIAAYINSIVLFRGMFPVDLYVTSSVFTVRATIASFTDVFGGEDVCEKV